MSKDIRKRGESIRTFLLSAIEQASEPLNASELSKAGAKKFLVTSRAIRKHLSNLEEQGSVEFHKQGRRTFCSLKELSSKTFLLNLNGVDNRDEMRVYVDLIAPLLKNIGNNAEQILEHCFTEMYNNVLDHSGATEVRIQIKQTAITTTILLVDNGIGIFKKIKDALGLTDERQSLLELSKGKFTTDPANHTGEGIFFSSRACNEFIIFSNGFVFSHLADKQRDNLTRFEEFSKLNGTLVEMTVNNNTATKLKAVFDRFSTVDGGFSKTEIPVKLLQYQNEGLVSRSQAKRLLARIENFRFVTFDFEGIPSIGQAFADQIFRVFATAHPEVTIDVKNTSREIQEAIDTAKNNTVLG